MKTGQIFWGVFFLVIGALFLLVKYDVIYTDWYFIWNLWPIVLILWGLAIILKGSKVKPVITILLALFIASIMFAFFSRLFQVSYSFDDYSNSFQSGQSFYEDYDDNIEYARFEMSSGAGTFIIRDETENLIDIKNSGARPHYRFSSSKQDQTANIELRMKDSNFMFNTEFSNRLNVRLNSELVWDLELNTGAAKSYFDLSKFKIAKLDLNTGATNTKIIIGDKLEDVNLDIEMGVASLLLEIPRNSGCKVRGNMVLMAKDLSGFRKIDTDFYETENFENAVNKIFIRIEGGVSSLEINRY